MERKKAFLWIVLFGTLIGFNESFIGSINMPFRSVILNSLTLILLFGARLKLNKPFSTLSIVSIAIIFKINNMGFYSCTTNALLCGPTALLMLGISFEIFSFIFLKSNNPKSLKILATLILTAFFTFFIFGILNTFILNVWKLSRFTEYVTTKALLAGLLSSVISISVNNVYNSAKIKEFKAQKLPINTIFSLVIIIFWILGTFVSL